MLLSRRMYIVSRSSPCHSAGFIVLGIGKVSGRVEPGIDDGGRIGTDSKYLLPQVIAWFGQTCRIVDIARNPVGHRLHHSVIEIMKYPAITRCLVELRQYK